MLTTLSVISMDQGHSLYVPDAVTTEARRYPAVLPAPLNSPSCRCICTPVT